MFCVIPADAGIQALGADKKKSRPKGATFSNSYKVESCKTVQPLFMDVQKRELACIAFARDSPQVGPAV